MEKIKSTLVIVALVLVAVTKASDTHVLIYFTIALEFSSSMHDRCFMFFKYMLCLEHLVVCSYPETSTR